MGLFTLSLAFFQTWRWVQNINEEGNVWLDVIEETNTTL